MPKRKPRSTPPESVFLSTLKQGIDGRLEQDDAWDKEQQELERTKLQELSEEY